MIWYDDECEINLNLLNERLDLHVPQLNFVVNFSLYLDWWWINKFPTSNIPFNYMVHNKARWLGWIYMSYFVFYWHFLFLIKVNMWFLKILKEGEAVNKNHTCSFPTINHSLFRHSKTKNIHKFSIF
jgi:hypothetical protein